MRSGSQVRVVSWNLDHWQGSAERRAEAWRYLDDTLAQELDWDVALLQECVPPAVRAGVVFRPVRGGPWGTAVVTRGAEVRHCDLEDDSLPGCLVAAEVDLGERGELTVVSMYGLNEFRKWAGEQTSAYRYTITSAHRLLSDLTPLIDLRSRVRSPRPLVLAGDLNVSTQLDPPDRERHANALERFASMGLTDAWEVSPDKVPADDCVCADAPGCGHVRTHRHRNSAKPWQDDYVFVNRRLTVVSCRTIIDEHTWQRSDHAPVAAILEAT
jgi:endonuclease/exonuclease/phosphatase family metal-dependent hydrolase